MAKKRKHSETLPIVSVKKDVSATERPKRTLMGWKDKEGAKESEAGSHHAVFRNKEKVLVTCSRRINFRYEIQPGQFELHTYIPNVHIWIIRAADRL